MTARETVAELYEHWRRVTGEPTAAGLLTLSTVLAESGKQSTQPDWLTVAEAAEKLGVHPQTLYRLSEAGKLPHTRIGAGRGSIRIAATDLHQIGKPATPARPKEKPGRVTLATLQSMN